MTDILQATAPDIVSVSCGAGIQSTAIALLIHDGILPRPDVAIFADTGWEPAAVYEQVDRLDDLFTGIGVEFIRVSNGNLRQDAVDPEHRYASIPYFVLAPEGETPVMVVCPRCDGARDVFYSDTDDEDLGLPPDLDEPITCPRCRGNGSVPDPSGAKRPLTHTEREGMGRRQCTSEYKLAPINRKIRELLGAKAPDYRRVPKGRKAEQWIGFSTDEVIRANRRKDSQGVQYLDSRYPLLDLGMSRKDCERYLAEQGWGHTVKSACIGCPFHGNAQWRELRDTCACGHSRHAHQGDEEQGWAYCQATMPGSPAANGIDAGHLCGCQRFNTPEWDDAVDFDEAIRKGGARGLPLDGTAYLHRSRVPLPLAPIDVPTRAELRAIAEAEQGTFDLFENGPAEGCSPYGCRSDGVA